MEPHDREVAKWLRTHDGLIGREKARALGLSVSQIHGYLDKGTWERLHRNVYRAACAPRTERQLLLAACMAAGPAAVASHTSAAWLWGLVERPPDQPQIAVPTKWAPHLTGVRIHRSCDLHCTRLVVRAGIPTTDAIRTLVDLGSVLAGQPLSEALDRGLATRLVTLGQVMAELSQLSRPGRPGVRQLRSMIFARGLVGAPQPSVLESLTLRLLNDYDLPTPTVELVAGPNGEYRLDFAYPPIKLTFEVDGYAWHFSPEQHQRDNHRRNRLQLEGWYTLVFTWMDITQRPHEVAELIRATIRTLSVTA